MGKDSVEGGGRHGKMEGDWNPPGMHKERKHLRWLNSSQSLLQKREREKNEGERRKKEREHVLQYISKTGASL